MVPGSVDPHSGVFSAKAISVMYEVVESDFTNKNCEDEATLPCSYTNLPI